MPLGYRLGEDKRIHVDEAPAPIVQEIFPYFIEHRTILSTFRMMRQKYRYEKSEKALGRALCNRAYLGEYYGIKGFCPTIIDERIFAQAQKVFGNRTRHPHSKMTYLFWGGLHCLECGRLLTPRNR